MKKFLLIIGVVMLSLMGMAAPVKAEGSLDLSEGSGTTSGDCINTFLWMRPWYYGLSLDGDCSIQQSNFQGEVNMQESIRVIVVNVIYDISVVVGILAAGFLIYGGYQFIYSSGDAAKTVKGRKTITAAIIGLVISVLGNIVVNTVAQTLGMGSSAAHVSGELYNLYDINPENMLGTVISFVLSLAAVVAVGFVIYSGVTFATAYGDVNKTARAKKGIIYSVAGLLVSMLAFAIVNFVLGGLTQAIPSGDTSNIFEVVNNVFGIVLGIIGFITVIGVVMGGIQYMTSAGDAGKMQKGKNTLIYSIVGLLVVLLAGAIISFVLNQIV